MGVFYVFEIVQVVSNLPPNTTLHKKLINEVIKPGPKTTAFKIYRFAVSNSSVNKTISITIEFLL